MKNAILNIFLLTLLLGCTSDQEQIRDLSGYWEIKKARFPEGGEKKFKYSQLVDYIRVEGMQGVRKKLRPQLGGKFIASEDEEAFQVKIENDSIHLYYSTPFSDWKETLLFSDDDELRILNRDGIIYTYKKFTPYSDDYGQKN